ADVMRPSSSTPAAAGMPFTSAIFSATSLTKAGSLRLPRWGAGVARACDDGVPIAVVAGIVQMGVGVDQHEREGLLGWKVRIGGILAQGPWR
ncbi:MAG: hypothetical protein ACKOCD_03575, partial [Nitrospiraceae bacterium]